MSEIDPALQAVGIEITLAILVALFVVLVPWKPPRGKKKWPPRK